MKNTPAPAVNESTAQRIIRLLLPVSHRRQFEGEDYQKVAAELTENLHDEDVREEIYNELSSSPDPGCECGFCQTARWLREDYCIAEDPLIKCIVEE